MKLIVFELQPDVFQTVRPTRNTIVESVRPHLYKHNTPDGVIVVEIQDYSGALIAQSSPVAIANISSEDYFHGHVKFDVKAYLQKGIVYRICIKGLSGYVFSENAYVGVCNTFDLKGYPPEYSPNEGKNAPLDIQIWSRNEK